MNARWWKPQPEAESGRKRHRCLLCPRECILNVGQRGFCGSREGSETGVTLTAYGKSSGICVDPIEKKPLYHFFPGSPVLSFGTTGCNLGCRFCQNWQISSDKAADVRLQAARPLEIAQLASDKNCRSVAFTYNDPVVFAEYAIDTARECRRIGVQTVAVTAGYLTEHVREEFFGAMDAANIDLKGFTDGFYRDYCQGRLEPVLETLKYVARHSCTWLEITTLLIPGANDSVAELETMTGWIAKELGPEVPLHFSAFHPAFRLRDRPATSLQALQAARAIARKNGLRHVYLGNVKDADATNTFCSGCGKALIQRDGYDITAIELVQGKCPGCGVKLAGRFN